MSLSLPSPKCPVHILSKPLTQEVFASFGTVIQNPNPSGTSSGTLPLPPNASLANQGSALKYVDVTNVVDMYEEATSNVPSRAAMNMFVCAPRVLKSAPFSDSPLKDYFEVQVMERHPYTTQTFVPLGVSATNASAEYLVIVAPSLSLSAVNEDLPIPTGGKHENVQNKNPGQGLPDLDNIQAFIAKGDQAITYGVGTWHAPMIVLGSQAIAFVVVQFANGVSNEDCQEIYWDGVAAVVNLTKISKAALRGTSKL